MNSVKLVASLAAGVCALFVIPGAAEAQFPEKRVSLTVPFAPGGSTGNIAHQLAAKLQELWGHPVVIENRPGANGTIGAGYISRQQPDGYNIMMHTVSFTMHPAVTPEIPYDARKDFTPIALIGQSPLMIGARPDMPADSVKDFIAFLKKNEANSNYSATGVGSFQHFAGELFNQAAGLNVQAVHYPGGGPAMLDAMAGRVDYNIASVTLMLPQVRSGQIKGIAVTSRERSPAVPELPSLHEAGVEGAEIQQWWGVFGPAGMPDDVVAAINKAVNEVLASPDIRQFIANDGGVIQPMSPSEFTAFVTENFDRWEQVAKAANIRNE